MSNSALPSPQEREAALFALALERPVAERPAFLQAVCGADSALRQRLEALLAAHEQPDELLGDGADQATVKATMQFDFAEEAVDEVIGQKIGRYKLLERVGEGGCGVVYVAEQTEPVRRRVALKVIKLGMDTKAVVARFEAERQALAMMDHPNIAKVLDAGSTEKGRPFFVMELVRGIRITDYCDQNNLPTQERLDLFIKVCQAIQHAHQKGIIHRDIKPSNILVTLHDGVPVPKVIDFGIAKATEGRLTDATVYTQLHQFIGTPAYMSPEQAEMSGLDIDTRSDIYSLGVLLYELLAGSTPFDAKELMASGIDAMVKTIREKEPMRPSTRLATLTREELTTTAKRRSSEAPKLIHLLRGDLDWIVMKCLEKDRTRRYETANGVAADIQRHLTNEPVIARPPSRLYEFQKTVRRHKVGFAATAAVILVLAVGVTLTTWQAMRATRSQRAAEVARKEAQASSMQARDAQRSEAQLRRQADAQAKAARQRAYASDINLAQRALDMNDPSRVQMLLDRQVPAKGEIDLRGWEWRYLWSQTRPNDHEVLLPPGSGSFGNMSFSGDGRLLACSLRLAGVAVMDLVSRHKIFEGGAYPGIALAHRASLLAYTEYGYTNSTLHVFDLTAQKDLIQEPRNLDLTLVHAFTPDNSVLLTLYAMGVGSYMVEPGKPRPSVERMPEPDETSGRLVATDVATGKTLWRTWVNISDQPHGRGSLDLSPDGRAVAVAVGSSPGEKAGVKVFDTKDGTEQSTIVTGEEMPRAVRFSPDGSALVTSAADADSAIRIWDALDGHVLGTLEGHRSYVTALTFTPDGRTLISSSGDFTIRFWDWAERHSAGVLRGHLDEVNGLAVSPDGKILASSCVDGSTYLWDLARLREHTGFRTFASSSSRVPGRGVDGVHKTTYIFKPQGDTIVEKPFRGRPVVWNTSSLQSSESPTSRANWLLALSPDGEKVVMSAGEPFDRRSTQQTYRVLHVRTGQKITSVSVPLAQGPDGKPVHRGQWMAFTADGKNLVLCQMTGRRSASANLGVPPASTNLLLDIWDTDTWQHRHFGHTVRAHEDWDVRNWGDTSSTDFSAVLQPLPQPSLMAMVEWSVINIIDAAHPEQPPRVINLFDTLPNRRIHRSDLVKIKKDALGKDAPIPFAAFAASPDASTAAAVSQEGGFLKIWDWKTLEPKKQFKAMKMGAYSLTYSPDGRRLAVGGSGDEAVKLWDTDTWDELLTLKGDGTGFDAVKFSPDGRLLLGVNANGKAHLWSVPPWEEIAAAEANDKTDSSRP